MGLRGQGQARGYAMAALLVMLGVMSIMMTAALPAWRFQAKREKELELVFRGEQYVKAIERYERKMGAGMRPPSIDVLVQQRFLRKKYKDPMTKDGEFQPLFIGANNPSAPGQRGGGRGGVTRPDEAPPGMPPLAGTPGPGVQGGPGGILGVVSKSKESSIRTYRGRTKYNEWQFVYAGAANRPGGPGGQGTPGMGGRGQPRPGLPGERGGRGGRGFPGPGRGGFGPGGARGSGGGVRGPGQ